VGIRIEVISHLGEMVLKLKNPGKGAFLLSEPEVVQSINDVHPAPQLLHDDYVGFTAVFE
jgi:hypothetical protein